MIATSSAPLAAQDTPSFHDHGHDHGAGHAHSHAVHDHGHDHGPAHGASSRTAQAVGVTLAPSFLRASLGVRLLIAGGFAVLIWALVLWAWMPIGGGAA